MPSLTYYLVSFAIKIKGIKKIFSEAPVNFQKLRKEDIHKPTKNNILGLESNIIPISKSLVTGVLPKKIGNQTILVYCHGGASVYGPTAVHWNSLAYIVKKTNCVAYLVDYPKAPEHQIGEINDNIDLVYSYLTDKHGSENIILLGDSMGGSLVTLLIQRRLKAGHKLPKAAILISPVMDMSLTNPAIDIVDKKDIMLSKVGVLSAKQMCAGRVDLKSNKISPLFGQTKGFVPTLLLIAENDILGPDSLLFKEKLLTENVNLTTILGKDMPHIWPILPIMTEAKIALNHIVDYIKKIG